VTITVLIFIKLELSQQQNYAEKKLKKKEKVATTGNFSELENFVTKTQMSSSNTINLVEVKHKKTLLL
jgi:hypothetical protein